MKEILTSCGGEEFIPLFARKELTFKEVQYMEDKDLREVTFFSLSITVAKIISNILLFSSEFPVNI